MENCHLERIFPEKKVTFHSDVNLSNGTVQDDNDGCPYKHHMDDERLENTEDKHGPHGRLHGSIIHRLRLQWIWFHAVLDEGHQFTK